MRFRLVYDGPLPSDQQRTSTVCVKQKIRRQMHTQLETLLHTHPALRLDTKPDEAITFIGTDAQRRGEADDKLSRGKFTFWPLIRERLYLTCHLDILFMRRAKRGDLVFPGGDIDNRIKVLLDGLQVPSQESELPKDDFPSDSELPFNCLLENDRLITGFNVQTDRLLSKPREGEAEDDVRIVIDITVNASKLLWSNMPFVGD